MKKYLGLVLACLIFVADAFAQINQPTTKSRKSKIVEMSNMLGDVEGFECKRSSAPLTGTIIKRNFDEDEIFIETFVLRDARDNRKHININLPQIGLLGRYASGQLSSILSKGSRARVWVYECSGGGSGVFLYADKVRLF